MAPRAYTKSEVRELLRERQGERTQKWLAEQIGIPQSNLSQIMMGRIAPTPTILRYLGLKRPEGYIETEDAA